jgi:purine nucleoside permease
MTAIKIKCLIATLFDAAPGGASDFTGEMKFWKERYWSGVDTQVFSVRGADHPLYVNKKGIAGAVLGVGKTRSSSSMAAILLDPRFDFSESYFLIAGVAGAPPSRASIGSVFWASWLVDYDFGLRWDPNDGAETPGEIHFQPLDIGSDVRAFRLNPELLKKALASGATVPLADPPYAPAIRAKYPEALARRAPFIGAGSHLCGDSFFHGAGLSREAQAICELYGADDYVATEMEGAAVAYVVKRLHGLDRLMSLRAIVNFDQGAPGESVSEHLRKAMDEITGDFSDCVRNLTRVGAKFVDSLGNAD